jgi:electron transport complex protein RnfB
MGVITAEAVDRLLPQTQCTRCGYAGCRPYADAVADGTADINRCPPGGESTISALAALLGRAALPLDPAVGPPTPLQVAFIDESRCIGCARCLPACPVDAIVGAKRMMHTVIAGHCTGCELCLPPCPVDCIVLRPAGPDTEDVAELGQRARERADAARRRFENHSRRLGAVADAERRAFDAARRQARELGRPPGGDT